MTSSDVIANFICLDELTQVIYQGAYQFIVLSTVTDRWIVHLGLVGSEGRWWHGSWTKTDVLNISGSKSSDTMLEAFAEKLADTLIAGQLHVTNWSSERGVAIKLTFSPPSTKPLDIPLNELTSAEAASHATNVLLDIALHAQARKCRLHPDPSLVSSYVPSLPGSTTDAQMSPFGTDSMKQAVKASSTTSSGDKTLREETRTANVKVEPDKRQQPTTTSAPTKTKMVSAPKGASLANPHKKARKYQAIEFESDEE